MKAGLALARAASGLVGTPFRLHGRSSETGVDCIGLLAVALEKIGRTAKLPTGYRLRSERSADLIRWAQANRLEPAGATIEPGDILVAHPGPAQVHILIVGEDTTRAVEANATLRKVVITPCLPQAQLASRWALIESNP